MIWEWTIGDTRSEEHQLIARTVALLPETSHGIFDNAAAVDGNDLDRAEESDSGSEDVLGSAAPTKAVCTV